jgi:hypothetical protein
VWDLDGSGTHKLYWVCQNNTAKVCRLRRSLGGRGSQPYSCSDAASVSCIRAAQCRTLRTPRRSPSLSAVALIRHHSRARSACLRSRSRPRRTNMACSSTSSSARSSSSVGACLASQSRCNSVHDVCSLRSLSCITVSTYLNFLHVGCMLSEMCVGKYHVRILQNRRDRSRRIFPSSATSTTQARRPPLGLLARRTK